MKTILLSALTSLSLCFHASLHAEPQIFTSSKKQTALMELYTSEGCSSCPPADRWLSNLKNQQGLWQDFIPLAFHVDYWDYIGWKDRFATPEYSDRQRRYSAQQSLRTVYTPGFVLNGREWRDWFKNQRATITPADNRPGQLTMTLNRNVVEVRFSPEQLDNRALVVNLALLGFGISSDVNRGENSGRTLTHDFVVLEHSSSLIKRNNDGSYSASLQLPRSTIKADKTAVVCWVNTGNDLTPIQAVGGYLAER